MVTRRTIVAGMAGLPFAGFATNLAGLDLFTDGATRRVRGPSLEWPLPI